MCLIIVKEQTTAPSRDILKTASMKNPHGLGVYWIDTKRIEYYNSKQWQVLLDDRPYIAHFRFATVGKVDQSNIHPFLVNKSKQTYLFQNGTIPNIGSEEQTDTEAMAKALRHVYRLNDRRTILKTYNCRFVEVSTKAPIQGAEGKNYVLYNIDKWHKRDGIMYSKSNCFTHRVAVYGTLKKGLSNNYMLFDSKLIGKGKTANKYKMWSNSIPYVNNGTDNANGHNISVEVYEVPETTLKSLDKLENHPNWYERKETAITMEGGEVETGWLYFNDAKKPKGRNYLSEFKPHQTVYGLGYNAYNTKRHISIPKVNPMASKHKPKRNTEADKSWKQFYNDYNLD